VISKKFFAHSLIYTIVGALPLATPILLLPLYTAVLYEGQVGEIALYTAFGFVIQVIANFSLDGSVRTFYLDYQNHEKQLKEYISTVYLMLIGIGGISLIMFSVLGELSFMSILHLPFFPFGFLSLLSGILNSFFKTYTGLLITQQRAVRFFYINIGQFLLTILFIGGGLYLFPHTLWGPIAGRFGAVFILFLITLTFFIQEYGIRFRYIYLHKMWKFCINMTLYSISAWILLYLDRYILNHYLDTGKVGIYDFATKCVAPIELLVIGLCNAIMPKVYQAWKTQDITHTNTEINRYFNVMTFVTLFSIALAMVLLPILIPFVVKKQVFYQSFEYIPYLATSYVFLPLLSIFYYTLLYLKRTDIMNYYFAFCAVLQIILNPVMISKYGVHGAIATVIIMKFLMMATFYWGSKKYFQFYFNWVKLFYLPLLFLFIVIIAGYFDIPQLYSVSALFLLLFAVYFKPLTQFLKYAVKRFV
jgi:O-antigen/teichoic acid export membrane protein